jgi:ACS family glucarate transporter-like MFS transporter
MAPRHRRRIARGTTVTSAAFRLRPTWVRQYVLAALCVVTALNYIQRNSLSGAETTIRHDLRLTIAETGNAASAFFLSYALCQIPSGWLAQRISPRWALALFAGGWSLATMACGLAHDENGLVGSRLAMGLLQAGVFPCATLILQVWYPAQRRALATAILNSFMLIGSAAGSMLTGALLAPLGWRWLFVVYALPGVVWAFWFAWWFRNRPDEHVGVNEAELVLLGAPGQPLPDLSALGQVPHAVGLEKREAITEADESARALTAAPRVAADLAPPVPAPRSLRAAPGLAIFLSWPLLFLSLQQFCRAGATRFFDVWFSTYLQEARGQPRDVANYLMSLPLWAGVVGGVVGGWVSDTVLSVTGSRRAGRQGVAIVSLAACFGCYVAALLTPNTYAAVALMSAGAFIAMFSAPCAYALSMDMGGRNLGVVFGTMNMVGNFGAYAFTWTIPRLQTWSGGWTLPVLVFAGMHVAAALCWLLLNPEGVIGEPAPSTT